MAYQNLVQFSTVLSIEQPYCVCIQRVSQRRNLQLLRIIQFHLKRINSYYHFVKNNYIENFIFPIKNLDFSFVNNLCF